jgi:hypothetical protein
VLVSWNADPDGNWGDGGGGAHTYEVIRDGASLQSGIAYGATELTDNTAVQGTEYLYTVRYWNCGGLFSETAGAAAADEDSTPSTPDAPTITEADSCAQTGLWISWDTDPDATAYDLRIDGGTVITDVTGPYLHDPTDSESHTYEVRARNLDCTGEWSTATIYSDEIGLFCDGFESGDTSGWM